MTDDELKAITEGYRVKEIAVDISPEAQVLIDQYHELIGARKAEYGTRDWRNDKLITWALDQIQTLRELYARPRVTLEKIKQF